MILLDDMQNFLDLSTEDMSNFENQIHYELRQNIRTLYTSE